VVLDRLWLTICLVLIFTIAYMCLPRGPPLPRHAYMYMYAEHAQDGRYMVFSVLDCIGKGGKGVDYFALMSNQ